MDIIIVSNGNKSHEIYWQKCLEELKEKFFKKNVLIACVTEDWQGGAGNALGTLHAYQKARSTLQEKHHVDILELQRKGASVALYHTAGQGKRLAPLTLSEGNNKSAIRLPGFWSKDDQSDTLSILEAVIKQTLDLSDVLSGRLGVFWGDQLFFPSEKLQRPSHDVEVFALPHTFPTSAEWEEKRLGHYGVIGADKAGHIKLCDKITFPLLQQLVQDQEISSSQDLAISLGSFSLSTEVLEVLLKEFKPELQSQKGKLDTDPHWWMPMTLTEKSYILLMQQRDVNVSEAKDFYRRMRLEKRPSFGITRVGKNSLWFDYGNIHSYFRNTMKLLDKSQEGEFLREFFGVELNDGCIIINSSIKSSNVKNCILVNVKADKVTAKTCVMMNSKLSEVNADKALVYKVETEENLKLAHESVLADVKVNGERQRMSTQLSRDGKGDWENILEGNVDSYRAVSERL